MPPPSRGARVWPAHQLSAGTPALTWATCRPQPDQVVLPQFLHFTALHMGGVLPRWRGLVVREAGWSDEGGQRVRRGVPSDDEHEDGEGGGEAGGVGACGHLRTDQAAGD